MYTPFRLILLRLIHPQMRDTIRAEFMTRSTVLKRKPSPDTLAAALARLDVPFVLYDGNVSGVRLAQHPGALLAGLAEQADARLRMAVIPLLLRHPQLAEIVPQAIRESPPRSRLALKIYYSAAMLLQTEYAQRLEQLFGQMTRLPDLYSQELGIPTDVDAKTRLQALASRHRESTGLALNWVGTYEHAAQRFILHAEKERAWAQSQPTSSGRS